MRQTSIRVFLPAIIIFLGACSEKAQNIPEGISWQTNAYSHLFKLGCKGKDSFLLIKNPNDTARILQLFHWGTNNQQPGCTALKGQTRIASMSAVFSGMFELLNCENRIVCVDDTRFMSTPGCRRRIKKGEITSVSAAGTLNKEKLLSVKPQWIVTYFIDKKEQENWQQMEKAGIPVIFCQNYLENHPLGRAEWVKVFGWLLGKPREAEAEFKMIDEHYQQTANAVNAENTDKPSVFCNAPYSGIWDVPAGNSYMARLLADAGANYIWKDQPGTGKITLDMEKVFQKAAGADFWINPGACRSLSCLSSQDRRLGMFEAIKTSSVYNSTAITTPEGANAWWDYAVVRPDLALKDLAHIFHPDFSTETEYKFVFFERLK
jgi:iron complex transport system substrate-binding protein